jgi:hypothetical protein
MAETPLRLRTRLAGESASLPQPIASENSRALYEAVWDSPGTILSPGSMAKLHNQPPIRHLAQIPKTLAQFPNDLARRMWQIYICVGNIEGDYPVRILVACLALLLSANAVRAGDPGNVNLCLGTFTVWGLPGTQETKTFPSTQKFRFKDGALFHSWSGRDEYYYNTVMQSPYNQDQLISGNMRFVINYDLNGYVIVADNFAWKITYLKCSD